MSAHILGKTAPTTRRYVPEYLITWLELPDVSANCFHPPSYIRSENPVLWFEKPGAQADEERICSQEMEVGCICRYRINFYQCFLFPGRRFGDLFERKNIR